MDRGNFRKGKPLRVLQPTKFNVAVHSTMLPPGGYLLTPPIRGATAVVSSRFNPWLAISATCRAWERAQMGKTKGPQ